MLFKCFHKYSHQISIFLSLLFRLAMELSGRDAIFEIKYYDRALNGTLNTPYFTKKPDIRHLSAKLIVSCRTLPSIQLRLYIIDLLKVAQA
jgi:hypothetical protein